MNRAVLRWRETSCSGIHIAKPQKGDTHTPPGPPPRSHHPWYLWGTWLSFLFLGGTNQTKEKSQEQNLHLVSRGLSSVKAEGVPVVGEDEKCATFYSILMLVWRVMSQGLSLLRKNVIQKSPSISCFAGMNFYDTLSFNDEDCFRRCLSESGHLTFRVSNKSQSTSNISGQEDLFSFLSWGPKWDKLCRTHIPHSRIIFLTLTRWMIFYFPAVKLSVWVHIVE